MGAYHAVKKIVQVLKLEGFESLVIGVPDEAWSGPHPSWWIDIPKERWRSDLLTPGYQTSTAADSAIYFLVHKDDFAKVKAVSSDMIEYLMTELVPNVRSQLEKATRDREFENDGDRGSNVMSVGAVYDYKPNEFLGAAKILLEISQYG